MRGADTDLGRDLELGELRREVLEVGHIRVGARRDHNGALGAHEPPPPPQCIKVYLSSSLIVKRVHLLYN